MRVVFPHEIQLPVKAHEQKQELQRGAVSIRSSVHATHLILSTQPQSSDSEDVRRRISSIAGQVEALSQQVELLLGCLVQLKQDTDNLLACAGGVDGVKPPNDPSSATRRSGRMDCNRDALAGFAAAHG